MIFNRGKDAWNELEEGVVRFRSKLNEKQSTIDTHKTVAYDPMIDWKDKKQAFITRGTYVTP